MKKSCFVLTICSFFAASIFSIKEKSVMVGESIELDISNERINKKDTLIWYFKDTRIALINKDINSSCLYDGEGRRFRDRLEADYETGSLTIKNITTEHAGRYEAEIIRRESSGTSATLRPIKGPMCSSKSIIKNNSNNTDIIQIFNVAVTDESHEDSHNMQNKAMTPVSGVVEGNSSFLSLFFLWFLQILV